ncbi:MAG: hypothetical protein JO040_05125 [Gemmatimonadetes bacterium]|nr:hypothetical protein [Gemmatimonadota bacterium]
MDEDTRIVLVPAIPAGMALDVVFRSPRGLAVQVTEAEAAELRRRGVPVAELYPSGNEYAAAVAGLSRDEAVAALESAQGTALAALDPGDRDRFGVA